jgi:adenylate cyclase
VERFPSVLAGRLANKHKELGDLYAEGGALAEAAEQYQRALEIRPRYVDIRAKLARALLELGEPDSAAGELQELLEINPYYLGARLLLGLAWYRMGDHEGARREWERCLEERPGDAQAEVYLKLIADS